MAVVGNGYGGSSATTKRVVVEPPRPFEPGFRPKFLLEAAGSGLLKDPSPRELPNSVALSVAASVDPSARGCDAAAAAAAWRGCGKAARVLAGPRSAALMAKASSRKAVASAPPPPVPLPFSSCANRAARLVKTLEATADSEDAAAEKFARAAEPLALIAEPRNGTPSSDGPAQARRQLRFGEAVQLSAQIDGEHDKPVALVLSPEATLAGAESELVGALNSSGREADHFFAVSGATQTRTADGLVQPGLRAVWEFHRANPVDGFPREMVVHYGQPLHIGQRPIDQDSDEILLSCEPPAQEGGATASYIVLARSAACGHPDPRGEWRKAFDTVFMFLKVGSGEDSVDNASAPQDATPLNLSEPALLVAVGPAQYTHEPRFVQLEQSGALGGHGRRLRASVQGGSREHAVEAVTMAAKKNGWFLDRLMLPSGSTSLCEERRKRAHLGLARTILGRALDAPPASIAGASTALWESSFARWELFRQALLPRIHQRGTLGFAFFRKALVARAEPVIQSEALGQITLHPGADEAPRPLEFCHVEFSDVARCLHAAYGVHVDAADSALISRSFASADQGAAHETTVDVDLFVDAVRGEVAPGRRKCLHRLYEQLQKEAGIRGSDAIDIDWVERRLWDAQPPDRKWTPEPELMPQELLRGLPLLRAHTRITRLTFVRWMLDLTYHRSEHASFAAQMQEMWGRQIVLDMTARESRLWNLMRM